MQLSIHFVHKTVLHYNIQKSEKGATLIEYCCIYLSYDLRARYIIRIVMGQNAK